MNAHSERHALRKRLAGKLDELAEPFSGTVFRFIAPKYSSVDDMFAGKGPLFADGRWLAKGHSLATYTALLPETALAEARFNALLRFSRREIGATGLRHR